jgi:hypothetical protein
MLYRWDGRMIMNGEQIAIWKKVVFIYLKVFYQTLPGQNDKHYGNPQLGQPITWK